MEPFGRALLDLHHGILTSPVFVHRDDGVRETLPIETFLRSEADLSPLELKALELCRGPVLDVGAGGGTHSLILQTRGMRVTAVDICPQAITVMRARGIADARLGNILEFEGESFSTILMLGRSLGLAGSLQRLDHLLDHVQEFLKGDGQILSDSLDIRVTTNSQDLSYQEANRRAGRYAGEVLTRFEYGGHVGPWCGWLHVDPDTLALHAEHRGFRFQMVHQGPSGDYLARLTPA